MPDVKYRDMIDRNEVNTNSVTILIVEDERIVAIDIGASLKSLGYRVVGIASTGEEAINLAEQKMPDLILMDIRIKGEMDGIETARKINSFADIPVIYLTAFADNDTLERAKTTEPFGYLLKPYDKKGLHTTIEMALYKHRMEKRVKESERWLATTLNSMGDAMVAADAAGRIIFMNPVAEYLTGWEQQQAMRKNITSVLKIKGKGKDTNNNPFELVKQKQDRILLNGSSYLVNQRGEEISILGTASPLIDDKNNISGMVVVFQDISEQKKIENELRLSEERFAKAFRASPHAVFISRLSDNQIIEVNDKWELLFGYKRDEVYNRLSNELNLYIKNSEQQAIALLEKNGILRDYETEILSKSGEVRQVNLSIEKIELNGETHLLSLIEDITDRKRAEKEREVLFRKVSTAQERLKILSSRLMEIQEIERRNLARELHDEIGQILTAIKINLQMSSQFIGTSDIETHIRESIELTEEAIKQVRSLSLDLRPSMLDDLGLIPALRWYIDRQSQRTGINARLVAEPIERRLSPNLEIAGYRIVQEAITNVIRHAGTDVKVKVELWIKENELNIKVSDNGKGFDVYAALQKSLSGKSMGIIGMQERVELLGGTLKINSKAGKGTDIYAVFGLEQK
ncbi:MAG: PAS domain S-box protein [Ignavibacteriaceae bacterium]